MLHPKAWGPQLWGLMEGERLSENMKEGDSVFAVSDSVSGLSFALMTLKSLLFLLSWLGLHGNQSSSSSICAEVKCPQDTVNT